VQVICVDEFTTNEEQADPPIVAVAPVINPEPAMVTEIPPAKNPVEGLTEDTVGAAWKVKRLEPVPDWVSELVTITLTVPAACVAVVHVREVDELTEGEVHGLPPTVTVAPVKKPVPVKVIAVPPAKAPADGAAAVTVGAG
jgi:hypothetical protein